MRKLVSALTCLAVLTVLAEAVLRFGVGLGDPPLARLDPDTEYELVPSAQYRRWGNTVTVNQFGMRTRDHPATPAEAERRVLLIGDSVIYGTHFLDQDETIAAVLEARLAGVIRLGGCRFLALPMAVSSWGPENAAAFLAREGTFGAVAAAVVVSAHDLYDVPRSASDILPYRLTGSHSAISDAVEIIRERLWRPQPEGTPVPPEASAARSLLALDAMLAQLQAAGIRPILVYHPTTAERAGEAASPERARFRAWADAQGLRFLDLGTAIVLPDGYRDTIHPDATGAARIAGALADTLADEIPACLDPGAG